MDQNFAFCGASCTEIRGPSPPTYPTPSVCSVTAFGRSVCSVVDSVPPLLPRWHGYRLRRTQMMTAMEIVRPRGGANGRDGARPSRLMLFLSLGRHCKVNDCCVFQLIICDLTDFGNVSQINIEHCDKFCYNVARQEPIRIVKWLVKKKLLQVVPFFRAFQRFLLDLAFMRDRRAAMRWAGR